MLDSVFDWGVLVAMVCFGIIFVLTGNVYLSIIGGVICGCIWPKKGE